MEQGLFQSQRLGQEQIMAPQQIQSLEILLLPTLELQQKISQELEINPTLELVDKGTEDLIGDVLSETLPDSQSHDDLAAEAVSKDEALNDIMAMDESWRDHLPSGTGGGGGDAESESKRKHFFDSLSEESSLHDHLMDQVRTLGLSEDEIEFCTEIIGNIDEKGYLVNPIEDIALSLGADLRSAKKHLKIIQSLDPIGIASKDFQECMLLQLTKAKMERSLSYKLVEKHLEDVEKNHIPQLAKQLKVQPTDIYEALEELKQFNPFPGRGYTTAKVQFTSPETFIEMDEYGTLQVRASRDTMPRVRISPQYRDLLEDPSTTKEVKTYIRDKILSSNLLIKSLEHRESTIVRITKVILEKQKGFFDEGLDKMVPMTMQQVADVIGVHETTVSRAVSAKYVQTPKGLFPFRFFFNSGYTSSLDGKTYTSIAVKQIISDAIYLEDNSNPLSDKELNDQLADLGLKIARRTVAKYREDLGLSPANLRKTF